MALPIALQLYTVRDVLAQDFVGTLQKVRRIGYEWVELAGYHQHSVKDARKILDDVGLKACGAHMGIDGSEANIRRNAEDAKTLGCAYVVSSGYPGYQWGKPSTTAQWVEGVRTLTKVSDWAKKHGVTYAYHNHSFEFEKLDNGRRPMDLLYDDAQPPLNAELDVYWVKHGWDDPLAWIAKLTGRLPLLHIKDMAAGAERPFAEVGTGVIDMKKVVAAAPKAGVKFLIIEQDGNWKGSSLESATISYQNFRKVVG